MNELVTPVENRNSFELAVVVFEIGNLFQFRLRYWFMCLISEKNS